MARNFKEEAASLDFSDDFSVQWHRHSLCLVSYVNKKYINLDYTIYKKLTLTSEQNKADIICYKIAEIDFADTDKIKLTMII